VGETHALLGDPVDVGRAVAHQSVAVATQIGDTDIIAPDHDDIRLGACSRSSHLDLLSLVGWFRTCLLNSVSQSASLRGASRATRQSLSATACCRRDCFAALTMKNLVDLNNFTFATLGEAEQHGKEGE